MYIKKERFETNAYFSSVAVPTTKTEVKLLQELKYGLLSDKNEICNWHPEWLVEDTAVSYANALGYSKVEYNGPNDYMDASDNCRVTATPSNLECMIAGYRLLGRHRKVSMILKKIKSLGIQDQVSNMAPGRQA